MRNKGLPKGIEALLAGAFWLAIWALAARLAGNELLLAGPGPVFALLWLLVKTPDFWQTVGVTLLRIFLGFSLGCAAGVLLAGATFRLRPARVLLAPLIRVVRAVPVASFILILLVWCRNDAVPVWIAALMVAPTVWAGVDKGLQEVDGQLLEMGRVFGFSFWKRLREIELPSVLPYFLSSVSASLGLAWKAGVAAEVLCTPADSIGKKIYEAKVYLETPELFAWTVVVVLISMALEALILWALSRLPGGRTTP